MSFRRIGVSGPSNLRSRSDVVRRDNQIKRVFSPCNKSGGLCPDATVCPARHDGCAECRFDGVGGILLNGVGLIWKHLLIVWTNFER